MNGVQVYWSPSTTVETFDISYLSRLKARDPDVMEHFAQFFNRLLKIKLRAMGYRDTDSDDIRNETLLRVLIAVDRDKVEKPESLPGYVYGVCEMVHKEQLRKAARQTHEDPDFLLDVPDPRPSPETLIRQAEARERVHSALEKLKERDRRILTEVFLNEKPKDVICRESGITREYLRVLVHRALRNAKDGDTDS